MLLFWESRVAFALSKKEVSKALLYLISVDGSEFIGIHSSYIDSHEISVFISGSLLNVSFRDGYHVLLLNL